MINKYLLLFISFSFCIGLNAQENENDSDISFQSKSNEIVRPKAMLKLALLSQLDFNSPSLQLGLELKATKWLGIHQELGYVNNWLNPFYTLIDHSFSEKEKIKNGLKYIFDARFYPFNKESTFGSRIFFAPSFDFRYVVIQRKEWVTRANIYQQEMQYNVQKLAYGMHAKFGFTVAVNKAMPVDMVVGLGARHLTLSNNLPKDAQVSNGQNNFLVGRPNIVGNFWYLSAYLGMLLHLPIHKKNNKSR